MQCSKEGTWYCKTCRTLPSPHVLSCIGCKQEHHRGKTCAACQEDTPLVGLISAGAYSNQALQRGIEWLKFKGIRPLAEILAALLIPRMGAIAPVSELAKSAVLVPIPLHPWRLRTRGFNQSEDIAHTIGLMCGIQVTPLLERTVATPSQAHLPHSLRTTNMEDAFSLAISEQEYMNLVQKKPIVIIVDDVSTTGSTLSSAASAFPRNSDIQIWGAVVARG